MSDRLRRLMSDINSDPMPRSGKVHQTTLVPKEQVESRYQLVLSAILEHCKEIPAEMNTEFYLLRKSVEELTNQLFDNTELCGRLAQKIEEWVGVAEETG